VDITVYASDTSDEASFPVPPLVTIMKYTILPNSNHLRDLIRDYGSRWDLLDEQATTVRLTAPPLHADSRRPKNSQVSWVCLNKSDVGPLPVLVGNFFTIP
jgi:hypothetical protein